MVYGISNLACTINQRELETCNRIREHIAIVCRTSHFPLRNIGSMRRYLTTETFATLLYSLISFKFDYCDSLLIELPETQINSFQRIQNSAARFVSRWPRQEHITPSEPTREQTNKKFGDRVFSVCGPVLWNRLPKCMKEINSLDKFKR